MNENKVTPEQEPAVTQEARHKPSKRDVIKMIFGAYIGMLPFLLCFVGMMILMFLLVFLWGG